MKYKKDQTVEYKSKMYSVVCSLYWKSIDSNQQYNMYDLVDINSNEKFIEILESELKEVGCV